MEATAILREAETAVASARDAGDPASLAAALDRHLWPMLSEHLDETLALLGSLDDETLDRLPSLRLGETLGIALRGGVTPAALAPASSLFWMTDLSEAERDGALLRHVLVARMRGEYDDARETAARLRSRLSRGRSPDPPQPYDLAPLHWSQLGTTELIAGSTSQAIADLAQARRACAPGGVDPTLRLCLSEAALAHAVRGTLDDALRLLREAQRLPLPTGALAAGILRGERLARAAVAVERHDPDAGALLEEIGDLARWDERWPLAALVRGRHLLAEQRPSSVIELVAQCRALHRAPAGSPAADVLAALTIDAFCALDELAAADGAARSAAPGPASRGARLRLLIRLGDLARADTESRRIVADPGASLDQRSEALILSLWIAIEAGADVEPSRCVAASRIATHSGLRRLFTTVPHTVLDSIARSVPATERAGFESVVAGLPYISDRAPRPRLTARETAVLAALTRHAALAELAEALFVSPNTVKSQLRSLYRKLGVHDRAAALVEARRLHLLPPG